MKTYTLLILYIQKDIQIEMWLKWRNQFLCIRIQESIKLLFLFISQKWPLAAVTQPVVVGENVLRMPKVSQSAHATSRVPEEENQSVVQTVDTIQIIVSYTDRPAWLIPTLLLIIRDYVLGKKVNLKVPWQKLKGKEKKFNSP